MRNIWLANAWVSGLIVLALIFAHLLGLTSQNTLMAVFTAIFVGGCYALSSSEPPVVGFEAVAGAFATIATAYGFRFYDETVGLTYLPTSWGGLIDGLVALGIMVIVCIGAAHTAREHRRLAFVAALPGIGVVVIGLVQLARWAQNKKPLEA